MFKARHILFALSAPVLACGKQLTYPCDEDIDSPVFEVRRMYDSATNAPISAALFSDFVVDGKQFTDAVYRIGGGPGVEVINSGSMRCTAPCKFGVESHVYGFLVTASGYKPKRVEYLADWTSKSGSCPVILKGETVVEIALEKSA